MSFSLVLNPILNECVEKDVELECVEAMTEWMENGAEFKGRKDSDFVLLFLRSCDFDLDLAKNTMHLYYENRVKYPQWWANRDINCPVFNKILHSGIGTVLSNTEPNFPSIGIVQLDKVGPDARLMNAIGKAASVMLDVGIRRPNTQLNGGLLLVDLTNCPLWVPMQLLWLKLYWDAMKAFVWSLPVKGKAIIFINCSPFCKATLTTFKFFMPETVKQMILFFGSDWSKLSELVPFQLLPDEYGGSAGPLKHHRDEFIKEVLLFDAYFKEEKQFGFQNII